MAYVTLMEWSPKAFKRTVANASATLSVKTKNIIIYENQAWVFLTVVPGSASKCYTTYRLPMACVPTTRCSKVNLRFESS